jgi:hypothetical protein
MEFHIPSERAHSSVSSDFLFTGRKGSYCRTTSLLLFILLASVCLYLILLQASRNPESAPISPQPLGPARLLGADTASVQPWTVSQSVCMSGLAFTVTRLVIGELGDDVRGRTFCLQTTSGGELQLRTAPSFCLPGRGDAIFISQHDARLRDDIRRGRVDLSEPVSSRLRFASRFGCLLLLQEGGQ